ncbi:MAG: hypothetical protein IJ901_01345 [Bacteroidaceae bacterium]|nr:hypothetical protein [Bacteroidaceae bacterium]
MQQILVILIIAIAVSATALHIYRWLTGKHHGTCHSCPHSGCEECHCHEKP